MTELAGSYDTCHHAVFSREAICYLHPPKLRNPCTPVVTLALAEGKLGEVIYGFSPTTVNNVFSNPTGYTMMTHFGMLPQFI